MKKMRRLLSVLRLFEAQRVCHLHFGVLPWMV